jgi:hypothetical protein
MLTDKEKRMITSPLSFSSKQRKNTKFRTRKKIQNILQDLKFIVENNDKICSELGIDVTSEIPKYLAIEDVENNSEDIQSEEESHNDPDFL